MESGARKAGSGMVSTPDFRLRTFLFAAAIVRLVESIPDYVANPVLGRQLLRSAPSLRANVRAAKRAISRDESAAKLGAVEGETDESLYWLELFKEIPLLSGPKIAPLLRQANEILAITVSSITANRNARNS